MGANVEPQSALSHLRVLDLSDEKGAHCAKLLADLGADAIKIEPPSGDQSRHFGPFVDDLPHPDRSLFFFSQNTNKRGITLNLEDPRGQDLFRALVKEADILVESNRPGYLAGLGLGYDDLRGLNPGLVMVSITTFGQHGPHAHYDGGDMVAWAMSGYMAIVGYEDPALPPLNVPSYQCCIVAGYYGAIGALAALHRRSTTGGGQQVDVSMQEAMITMSESPNVFYSQDGVVLNRFWGYTGDPAMRRIFRCKDGYVDMPTGFVRPETERWRGLVAWMKAEGMAEDLEDEKWLDRGYGMAHMDHAYQLIEAWTLTHTAYELYQEGQGRRLEIAPINDIPSALRDPQLNHRGFFVQVEHPELGRSLTYPGAPYDFQETPWKIRRRAPLLGEHNLEIYQGELGMRTGYLDELMDTGVI